MPTERRYKRPESVLVVIYRRDAKVLLMRRVDDSAFWQSVTGSMDWDESEPRITALRELQEETGIEGAQGLEDLEWVQHYTILPQWRGRYAPGVRENCEHAFVLCVAQDCAIRLNPNEHSEYQWLAFSEAAKCASSWSNRAVIGLLQQRYAVGVG